MIGSMLPPGSRFSECRRSDGDDWSAVPRSLKALTAIFVLSAAALEFGEDWKTHRTELCRGPENRRSPPSTRS